MKEGAVRGIPEHLKPLRADVGPQRMALGCRA